MKLKIMGSILLTGVAASAATVAFPSYAQSNFKQEQQTKIFECQIIQGNYTTTMNHNNQSYPMIVWQNNQLVYDNDGVYDNDEVNIISAAQRCESVSNRINNVYTNYQFSNSQFGSILNYGRVSLQVPIEGELKLISPTVICAGESPCDQENMLFTLSGSNAQNPAQTMNQFVSLLNNPGEYEAIIE
ncbi:COP23 domain-containing protein [Oscillatoria acuminata]|uniref:Circadian oscillating protein COP23 n=1 Tax=Oscillatoria acuminata PCC 6304 TaxID=56110 RepID=K9TGB3_9CYAN|nr:COP23 domain-containing protein [Oscillatoria acuminata]AFY81428.1 hypothetical protein Oscil6304_1747 [Oscillatoria acuminata PCC 6304]